ncbi:MAG: metal ABC transporter ATP-binding protein [Dehalococcoidia bacterium]|nr:metal ABC transporter ATP-binding protein [Dehalococcoidia bacterium]MDH4299319.1 metal ABC transporter ATP-binding protein [Dehalococcoidia bacterium]MDH4367518.1 metal ABC transporter ATP-binding protein [Dehalococcoidia bacterium]
MDNTVIRIQDAVVSYREDVALQGVSLQIRKGEFVGIIGPNGAGKTTLLTVINGLGKLVHGQVWVLGSRLNGTNGNSLRKRIGYVAQVENIDPRLPISVREMVMVGCYGRLGLFHRPTRADWEIVDKVLEMVGMAHLSQRPIGHLSGGEYQRAAIARALVQQPEIFLLDEPTASIDQKAQHEILSLIQLIHREYHMTTLFVTHDLRTLPPICQRLILMKEGKVWRQGSPESMLREEVLSQLYEAPISVPNGIAPLQT